MYLLYTEWVTEMRDMSTNTTCGAHSMSSSQSRPLTRANTHTTCCNHSNSAALWSWCFIPISIRNQESASSLSSLCRRYSSCILLSGLAASAWTLSLVFQGPVYRTGKRPRLDQIQPKKDQTIGPGLIRICFGSVLVSVIL
jgi:hypothetical protein